MSRPSDGNHCSLEAIEPIGNDYGKLLEHKRYGSGSTASRKSASKTKTAIITTPIRQEAARQYSLWLKLGKRKNFNPGPTFAMAYNVGKNFVKICYEKLMRNGTLSNRSKINSGRKRKVADDPEIVQGIKEHVRKKRSIKRTESTSADALPSVR